MEIIDIQEIKPEYSANKKYEITFDDGHGDDGVKIIMNKDDLWQIHNYCEKILSYGAQLKKKKR